MEKVGDRGGRQGYVNKQARREEEERKNVGNQGGISWYGAEGEAGRKQPGKTRDSKIERRDDGQED